MTAAACISGSPTIPVFMADPPSLRHEVRKSTTQNGTYSGFPPFVADPRTARSFGKSTQRSAVPEPTRRTAITPAVLSRNDSQPSSANTAKFRERLFTEIR
jgi:hypothetical protein